jgi:hypothetical protein
MHSARGESGGANQCARSFREINIRHLSPDIASLLGTCHSCGTRLWRVWIPERRWLCRTRTRLYTIIRPSRKMNSGRFCFPCSFLYSPTMASPPNQAGPPQVPSAFSPTTTMTVTLSSSSASETADSSTVTTVDSTIASTQTTGQPQSSSQSSKVGLNTLQITAIAVGSSILVLALVAGIVYWLFVRREKRRQSAAATRTLGATEKYGQDSEYTPTFSYNQIPKDHGGTDSPLIKSPTARSRAISGLSYISSQYDNESRRFPSEDAPSSRFINGEDEIIQIPLSHAISLSDAIPNAQPDESLLDSASLLPYLTRSPSKHLPDLPIAPDTSPPTRRSSRRKNPNPWRGSGYDSDETDSMYSQASASTVKLYDAPSATAIHELPASLVPATNFPTFLFPTNAIHSRRHYARGRARTETIGGRK